MSSSYFHDIVDPEELKTLHYIPTIPLFLDFIRESYGSFPAVSDKTNCYTYAQFVSRIARRVSFLQKQGFPAGAHIAVLAPNNLDAMELLLAIPAGGYTVFMLPAGCRSDELAAMVRKFDISAVFAAPEFLIPRDSLSCPLFPADSIGTEEAAFAPACKDTKAAIFLTGGTTGTPKGAVHTHGSILRGAYNGVFQPGHILHKTSILMLPLCHIFGSVMAYLSELYTGGLCYACADIKSAITDIPAVQPTHLVLVPGLAEIILGLAGLKGKGFLGRLNSLVIGAAPIPPRLIAMSREYGIRLCLGYGLTEGANLTSGNSHVELFPDSVGAVYPEQETKLVNGELWIRGDNIMTEYYHDPEATAQVLEDGWLKTGDLAEFSDNHGTPFLVLTGRIKNLIILPNGENVSPEEIESLFYQSPLVKDCLVQEAVRNGIPVIEIEILPSAALMQQMSDVELREALQGEVQRINRTLPGYKQVLSLKIRKEEFLKSGAMKILRNTPTQKEETAK